MSTTPAIKNPKSKIQPRVVITGVGMISPLGHDLESSWAGLVAGKSGTGPITHWDATDFPTQICARVNDWNPQDYMDRREARRTGRATQFAWKATREALAMSGLDLDQENKARMGVEMDVVKIAPWKTAMDQFANSAMSDADRAQRERLLDGWYEDLVAAIAVGRKLAPESVRGLIDRAPLFADDALAAGLIDGICYEDELSTVVGKETGRPAWEAKLVPYKKARRYFYQRPVVRNPKAIGVIGLHGMITSGESRSFPVPLPILGEETIGSATAQQMARAAREDDRLAAVVVHVDSGGGSALASDLIWRELDILAHKIPVVVYMGDVAASGGYFIATPGRKIVAQRATLTGSIGVITGKPVTAGAYAHLGANREFVQRGANAGLYSDMQSWSAAERAQVEHDVRHTYDLFKHRVADGRKLDFEGLDAIANGQVWTGAQAQAIGLVDEIGDFQTAMLMACDMAGLPTDYSVPIVPVKTSDGLIAQPFKQAKESITGLSVLASAVLRGEISELFGRERIWFIADGLPKIK